MAEQLSLDFNASVSVRMRRAKKAKEQDALQPQLFVAPPNIDVHLHSPAEAVAQIAGSDPDRTINWLMGIVGNVRVIKSKRVAFPSETLDRLLHIRPPAQVTLDAASAAVGRAIWARKLGLKPLRVTRERQRLIASSPRWPGGFGVKDAPWSTIATLIHLGVPVDVDPKARNLMTAKLSGTGTHIATAGLAGGAVMFEARQPQLLENLGLPALAYAGEPQTGLYKMPLLAAEPLLSEPSIKLSPDLTAAIKKATSKVKPLETGPDFPWTLYPFQAKDAAIGKRILETTGGTLLAGEMGSGKFLRNDQRILTPTGWTPIGELELGDKVMGPDGHAHAVTGVYPQGVMPLFEVEFTDGAKVISGDEHLWAVQSANMKFKGREFRVLPLKEIRNHLRDAAGNLRWYIPMTAAVHFEPGGDLPLDPYLLGALLGDGSLSSGNMHLTGVDDGIIAEVECALPAGAELRQSGHDPQKWCITGRGPGGRNVVRSALEELGVYGLRSWEKHVPELYKFASIEDRLSILQGLMDTDGGLAGVASKGTSSLEFTTTSEQLADDVQFLVESLGGTCRKAKPVRKTYIHNGEKRQGRPAWRLCICMPGELNPFRLHRKASAYTPRVKYGPARGIKNVIEVEPGEATCISVSSPEKLYLTERFVATHNTTVSLALAADMDIWPLLVVSPLSAFSTWERQLGQMGKKAYLATEAPAKSWAAIEEGGHDAVVISFDRLGAFMEIIEQYGFAGIIADEIQRIRTPGSKRSRALRALASNVPLRIGLSGTPLTNTLNDLLPVGAFLAPGEWRPRANTKDLEDLYPGDPIESIADHLGTLMVRRRMQDTGAKLPKRNDHRVYVQLTPEQRRALAALEAEAEAAKDAGEFDDPSQKMHAFVKLQRARAIINSPAMAGIGGPNPKVKAAVDLAEDFLSQGRKGVIFCADRTTFRDIGKELDAAGIGWVGIWGATPPMERIANEKKFHNNDPAPNGHPTSVVVCTIQAGAESWSASPTGTWLISTAYMYQAAILEQMECRVYRMNSDPNGPDIEIMYLHSTAPGGTLDDRMVEILAVKKQLFAQVVDRTVHEDQTKISYTMGDLVYLLTGKRDEKLDRIEQDKKAAADREQAMKDHAKRTLYAKKGRNKSSAEAFHDMGEQAMTQEEWAASVDEDLEELLGAAEVDEGFTLDMEAVEDGDVGDDDGFDVEEGDD